MKKIYKDFLFTKHILVNDSYENPDVNTAFHTLYSLANLFGIKVTDGKELACEFLIDEVAGYLGEYVPEPFYRGFPRSVLQLTEDRLLFDQMLHYCITYGLGYFDEAGHSVFEEYIERDAFKEKTEVKKFMILNEEEGTEALIGYISDLTMGTRPLNDTQYELVLEAHRDDFPFTVKSKNLAIRLLIDTRDLYFTKFLRVSDTIKVVSELNYRIYDNKKLNKLNLKNQDRKFISEVIHSFNITTMDTIECYEKKKYWAGLLHHIHFKAKTDNEIILVNKMRGPINGSVYSLFEYDMNHGDINSAITFLDRFKGSGALLRNMDYILSRCKSKEEFDSALEIIIDTNSKGNNGIILLQLLQHYANYYSGRRSFKFTRFNELVIHDETPEEVAKRKTVLSDENISTIKNKLFVALNTHYALKLGKVHIDPDIANVALPLQEAASFGGFGCLPKGSRLPIAKGKKIRAFTYWEEVDDIDLSVMGIRENGATEEYSWRTMYDKQSDEIVYSGDETSGWNGGSEYFDIDVELFKERHPGTRYLVFSNNVYSRTTFDKCICKAGYMLRDTKDSGEIFEPKTVKTSFTIDANSTFAYLFAIDLKTSELIWLNIARDTRTSHAAGSTSFDFLKGYFNITDTMSLGKFATILSTEIVDKPEDADVVISDKDYNGLKEGIELVHSYDFEKVMKWMNS